MHDIVLGLDGSRLGRAAAKWAATEAQRDGAHVIAIHAVPRTELWSLSAVQVNIDDVLGELRALLEGVWTAPLRKAQVPYTAQLVRGDPATELLRTARRAHAGMIVLGAKGHTALADLVVGGTVHKVINRSSIPVVLVPVTSATSRSRS